MEEGELIYSWKRENLFIVAGGNFYLGCDKILRVKGRDMLWSTKDSEGYELLNLDLFSKTGELLFSMRENDWLAYPKFQDIESPPSAKSLSLKSAEHDVFFDLKFSESSLDEVANLCGLEKEADKSMIASTPMQWISNISSKNSITKLEITGKIPFPVAVEFNSKVTKIADRFSMTGSMACMSCIAIDIN